MGNNNVIPLLTHTLGNGLQIIGHVMPDVESVAVCYYVRSGSRAEESPTIAGMAHFLEHMVFRTTHTCSGLELNQAFQRIGMEVNASTCSDATLYYASGLSDYLEQVIALLSDMMIPLFLEEEFETEKGAILNEILAQEEQPDSMLRQHMREVYFREHMLAHDGLGTLESVQNIRIAQMSDFWATHYSANNFIVSVAGNFREEHLITSLERFCGTWQTSEVPRTTSSYPVPDPITRVVVNPHLRQQFLIFAMPSVTKGHPDYLAAHLSARILEKRLYWSIVQKGLAEDIDVDLWSDRFDILRDAGIMSIETNTTPETAPLVLELIQRELSRLLQDGITEAELRRAKNMLISGRILGYEEDRLGRAWTLAEQWDFERRLLTVEEELCFIEQVSRDDVMRVLHLFPLLEKQVVAALGPLRQEELA
jgi:predicted Zn-dependent peptidase